MDEPNKTTEDLMGEIQDLRQIIADFESGNKKLHLLSSITKQVVDSVITTDLNYRITYVNPAFQELYGYSGDELLGQSPDILNVEPNSRQIQKDIYDTISSGNVWRGEAENRRKDGSAFPCDFFVFPLKDEQGNIFAYAGMQRDITERKQAEQELKKASTYIDAMGATLIVLDMERRVIEFNAAAMDLLGYSQEDICGLTLEKLFPEMEHDKHYASMKETLEDGQVHLLETSVLTKNGKEVPVLLSGSVLKDTEDKPIGFIGVLKDITERKRAEEAITDEKNKLQSVIDAMASGLTIRDLDYNLMYQSKFTLDLFGDRSGEKCYKVFENSDEVCEGCPVELAYRDGNSHSLIKDFKLPSGEVRYFENIANLIRNANGEVVACLEISTDITEHKQAEEELRLHGEIMKNMAEGVYLVGAEDGIIIWANPKFEKMFGYDAGEMNGQHASIVNAPTGKDTRETAREIMEVLNKTGQWHGDVNNIKKNGTSFWCYANCSIFNHPEYGRVIIAIHTDITERKLAEKETVSLAKFPSENPGPVLRIAKDGEVLYRNKAGEQLLAEWKSGVGKTVPEKWRNLITEAFASEKGTEEEEEEVKDKIFSITIAPVKEAGYANLYAHDITERKRAEEEIHENQRRLRSLASELSLAEERQRHRIATELHDTVSQVLAFALTKLQNIHETASGDNLESLSDVCGMVSRVVGSMRSMTFDICSPTLYKFDLETAVSELLDDKFTMRDEINYIFRNDSKAKPLSEDIKIVLFQSIRELVNNIIKHAQAHNVEVDIQRRQNTIRITVNDDGVGFNVEELKLPERSRGGFGLFSIAERLKYIGGSFEFQAEPGRGSSFMLEAPLEADAILCKGEDDGGEDINC